MSSRTQRQVEVEAMLAAQAESLNGQEVGESIKRITGLDDQQAQLLYGRACAAAAHHGLAASVILFSIGLDLGFRLGLEEAARMPALGPALPPPPPSKPSRSPRRWWIR